MVASKEGTKNGSSHSYDNRGGKPPFVAEEEVSRTMAATGVVALSLSHSIQNLVVRFVIELDTLH